MARFIVTFHLEAKAELMWRMKCESREETSNREDFDPDPVIESSRLKALKTSSLWRPREQFKFATLAIERILGSRFSEVVTHSEAKNLIPDEMVGQAGVATCPCPRHIRHRYHTHEVGEEEAWNMIRLVKQVWLVEDVLWEDEPEEGQIARWSPSDVSNARGGSRPSGSTAREVDVQSSDGSTLTTWS